MKKKILSLVFATLLCLGQITVVAATETTAPDSTTKTCSCSRQCTLNSVNHGCEVCKTGYSACAFTYTCKFGRWVSDGNNSTHTRTCPGSVAHGNVHLPHTETASCFGGTATCCTYAACAVCKGSHGAYDSTNHEGDTEIRDYVAPTFDKVGFSGNTHCTGCNAMLKAGTILDKSHFCQFGPWVPGNDGTHTTTCSISPANVHSNTLRCKDGDDADALCDVCGWDIGKAIAAGTYKETAEGKAVVVTTPAMTAKHRLLRGIVR